MWITRDENGDLWLFEEKPYRKVYYWTSNDGDCQLLMNSNWFPEVSWEDKEPKELVLKPINE